MVGQDNVTNDVDLNRDFPDRFRPNNNVNGRQPETRSVMQWSEQHNFILSNEYAYRALVVIIHLMDQIQGHIQHVG